MRKRYSTYTIKLTGEGEVYVQITLDDNLYREYTIDFNEGKIVNSQKYDYVESTQPATEDTTEPDDSSDPDATEEPDYGAAEGDDLSQ